MGSATAPFQFTYTGIILICIATKVMAGHEVPLFTFPTSDPGGRFGFIQNNNTDADGRHWRKKSLHHTLTIAHINPVFDVNFRMVHCLSSCDGIAYRNASDYRARSCILSPSCSLEVALPWYSQHSECQAQPRGRKLIRSLR